MPVLGMHLPKLFLPNNVTGEIETVKSVRSEIRIDVFPIGYGRRRSKACGRMATLARNGLVQRFFPENVSVLAIDRDHGEPVCASDGKIIVGSGTVAPPGRERLPDGNRRGDEDAVCPDDGCAVATTGQSRLPTHVLRIAPVNRRTRIDGDSRALGTSPLRPIYGAGGGGEKQPDCRKRNGTPADNLFDSHHHFRQ